MSKTYLIKTGRALYGIGIVSLGVHQLITRSFRPDILPPFPSWAHQYLAFPILAGIALIFAGGAIAASDRMKSIGARTVSLYLAFGFLVVIVICHLPYLLFFIPDKLGQLQYWFGVAETLAYCGGALVMARSFPTKSSATPIESFMNRLIPIGPMLFAILIFIFGCSHFVYSAAVSKMVPAWLGVPLFWNYLAGTLLICAAVAIIFRIRVNTVAFLLAIMLFLFFLLFHVPDAIANPSAGGGNEVVRAIVALLFCGISLVIAANSGDARTSPASKYTIFLALFLFLTTCTRQPRTFTNPLLPSGPDPWVEYYNGTYYVTHSTGSNLKLYRTRDVSQLADAESKIVWTPPATGMNSKEIWAPEIHRVNDKWYFYYAADDGDNNHHRMWVLENDSEDPFEGTWIDKGQISLPDNKWAIDGTIFEHRDTLYFLWSGWEGDVNVRQDIYITRMINPWTADSERVLLSKPELEWEIKGASDELPTVNEGPQFLAHGDKVFIVYSARGCWTDDYSLGMLEADANADLLEASSWIKSQQPVFQKDADAKAFGPGHNSFFRSPDGKEDWIIYHANPEAGQGCNEHRSPRMQPFGWKDGRPDFGRPVSLGKSIDVPSSN